MNTMTQTVTLKSDKQFGHRVPPHAFGELLAALPLAVRSSIRMVFEGRSQGKGPLPKWLIAASDIRFLGHSGDNDTVLNFETPLLGEAAAVLYEQQEFWPTPKPDKSDTGFDLLGDIVGDLASNNLDSERFDRHLLKNIYNFKKALNGSFQEMEITGRRFTAHNPIVFSKSIINAAKSLSINTPEPQQVRIVGTLDMIRASTAAFAVKLNDGREIQGVLVNGDSDTLGNFYKQQVLVLGKAIYRPSGNPLRIDAEEMMLASEKDQYFSQIPKPIRRKYDLRQVLREQQHKKGLSAIFGKWPGNETDEQVQQALQELG